MRTKTRPKTQMMQSFNQYSENETKIWRQNILDQFNPVSLSCLRSHFIVSLMIGRETLNFVLLDAHVDIVKGQGQNSKVSILYRTGVALNALFITLNILLPL